MWCGRRRNGAQTLRFPLIFSPAAMLVDHSIVAEALTAIAGLQRVHGEPIL
jgi:hypothetical protein